MTNLDGGKRKYSVFGHNNSDRNGNIILEIRKMDIVNMIVTEIGNHMIRESSTYIDIVSHVNVFGKWIFL